MPFESSTELGGLSGPDATSGGAAGDADRKTAA